MFFFLSHYKTFPQNILSYSAVILYTISHVSSSPIYIFPRLYSSLRVARVLRAAALEIAFNNNLITRLAGACLCSELKNVFSYSFRTLSSSCARIQVIFQLNVCVYSQLQVSRFILWLSVINKVKRRRLSDNNNSISREVKMRIS